MTGEQWRLSRHALALLSAEVGLTDRALAERLGVSVGELKPVIGMLIGTHRLDSCAGYLVLPVASVGREARAA